MDATPHGHEHAAVVDDVQHCHLVQFTAHHEQELDTKYNIITD